MLNNMGEDEVFASAKKTVAQYDIVAQTKQMGRLLVVQFAARGIATPVDAAVMMQLGCDGVMLEYDVCTTSTDPLKKICVIVQAVRKYFRDNFPRYDGFLTYFLKDMIMHIESSGNCGVD